MLEEVGQDIGKSLGRLIEIDRRACQSDQAKFMHIRVDLPIDKPLRRGGNVVSRDGEKYGSILGMRGFQRSVIFAECWAMMISTFKPL